MKCNDIKADLHKKLMDAGIRPSMQRIEIFGFISSCSCHPTAEEIYTCVHRSNPSLSRATVFSNVKLLAEKGLINDINISSESTRYDSMQHAPHAHFVCRKCGKIFDIPLDMPDITMPDKFHYDSVNVYFKGICPECDKTEKTEQ